MFKEISPAGQRRTAPDRYSLPRKICSECNSTFVFVRAVCPHCFAKVPEKEIDSPKTNEPLAPIQVKLAAYFPQTLFARADTVYHE